MRNKSLDFNKHREIKSQAPCAGGQLIIYFLLIYLTHKDCTFISKSLCLGVIFLVYKLPWEQRGLSLPSHKTLGSTTVPSIKQL